MRKVIRAWLQMGRGGREKLVKEIQGIVFVNGIQLEACSYLRIYSDDTRNIAIPVLAIVKALEAQIRETEAGIFQIQYGSEKFILDTNSKILTEYGKEWNLIGSTPGACNPYHERRESDFYADNISFLLFLNMIGAEIKYSYSTGKVIITNKTGDGSVSSAND